MSTRAKPNAETLDLLQAAQQELAALLPTLPSSAQYSARMIANALATASRQLAEGQKRKTSRAARWRRLAKAAGVTVAPGEQAAAAISSAIRSGKLDEAAEQKLRHAMAADTSDWLAVDNPKALRR